MSTIMTLTSRKQITLGKELLEHLGVKGGDQIFARKIPGGKIEFSAHEEKISIDETFDIFDKKNSASRKSAPLDSRFRGNDDGE